MKNKLIHLYIAAFYFCSSFVMIAQQPGSDNDGSNGGLEGDTDTTPAAPIDDYLWVLVLIGLTFAILKFRAIYKQEFQMKE